MWKARCIIREGGGEGKKGEHGERMVDEDDKQTDRGGEAGEGMRTGGVSRGKRNMKRKKITGYGKEREQRMTG